MNPLVFHVMWCAPFGFVFERVRLHPQRVGHHSVAVTCAHVRGFIRRLLRWRPCHGTFFQLETFRLFFWHCAMQL